MCRALMCFDLRRTQLALARFVVLAAIGPLIMTDTGCRSAATCEAPKLEHANGLSVCHDARVLRVVKLDDGFELHLSPEDARQNNQITVRAVTTDPRTNSWRERTLDGRSYWFTQSSVSGGSGGPEFTLSIFVPKAGRNIVVEHYTQTESPDFDVAWQIARTVEVSSPGR